MQRTPDRLLSQTKN